MKINDPTARRDNPAPVTEPRHDEQPHEYRKRAVVIEAVRWTGTNDDVMERFMGSRVAWNTVGEHDERIHIRTLEGVMTAQPGDWIIRGVKGEFYPCKPDIFAATYEPATLPPEHRQPRHDWHCELCHFDVTGDICPVCLRDNRGNTPPPAPVPPLTFKDHFDAAKKMPAYYEDVKSDGTPVEREGKSATSEWDAMWKNWQERTCNGDIEGPNDFGRRMERGREEQRRRAESAEQVAEQWRTEAYSRHGTIIEKRDQLKADLAAAQLREKGKDMTILDLCDANRKIVASAPLTEAQRGALEGYTTEYLARGIHGTWHDLATAIAALMNHCKTQAVREKGLRDAILVINEFLVAFCKTAGVTTKDMPVFTALCLRIRDAAALATKEDK